MRIAMLTPLLGDAYGQERVVRDSTRLLREKGHEVHFLTENIVGLCPENAPENKRVEIISGLSALHWLSPRRLVKEKTQLVFSWLKKTNPDVIHFIDQWDYRLMREIAQNYPTLMTSHTVATTCPASHRRIQSRVSCEKKSGLSCLWTTTQEKCLSHFPNSAHQLNAWINYSLRVKALKQMHGIVAISHFVKGCLEREGWPAEKIHLVYNPVEVPQVQRTSRAVPLFICASRLVDWKGVSELVEKINQIRDLSWELWICGEGPEKSKIEKLIASKDLSHRVFLKGKFSFEQMREAFSSCSALIQPNTGPEPFGLSVAEASSLGVPVIAFDVPALNEIIISGKSGWLVPWKNWDQLLLKLSEISRNPKLSENLKFGPEVIRRRFSPEKHLEGMVYAYQACIQVARSQEKKILKSLPEATVA